eukprot:6190686-Pleurochrysis_carterae.AAC.1
MPEASAVAAVQFRADLSAAQLAELWKEEEEKAGDLLAHITSLDLEAPQHLLWRDLMLETLLFAKNEVCSDVSPFGASVSSASATRRCFEARGSAPDSGETTRVKWAKGKARAGQFWRAYAAVVA